MLLFTQTLLLTYVNGPKSGSVLSSHILVESLDSLGSRHLSVLLVHVVGTGSRIVSEPDTEVLDLEWSLLADDVEGNDFTGRLLDLSEFHQKVPES